MKKGSGSPFAAATYKANPYILYDQLRRETPVHKTILPNGTEVYLVIRYEDVQAGLKDSRLVKNISNARGRGRGLLEMLGLGGMRNKNMLRADQPAHTRLRSLANEAFKPKYICQLRGHIEQIANRLVDNVQAAGEWNSSPILPFRCRSRSSARCWASRRKITSSSGSGPAI